MTQAITQFSGAHRFLSNFFPAYVTLDGYKYITVEHAYQAAKTKDQKERCQIRKAFYPSVAKRLGKKVTLRDDWDEVKVMVMTQLVRQKFSTPAMRVRLLETGDAHLEEGNYWNDTFWGTCNGKGENHLGKILMQVREEIR